MFVHSTDNGLLPSIVDPHSVREGDSGPKLKALAQYADEHGDQFERIIAVGIEKDGALYGMDLKDTKVRSAVYQSPVDKDSLETLYEKHGTKYTTIQTGA